MADPIQSEFDPVSYEEWDESYGECLDETRIGTDALEEPDTDRIPTDVQETESVTSETESSFAQSESAQSSPWTLSSLYQPLVRTLWREDALGLRAAAFGLGRRIVGEETANAVEADVDWALSHPADALASGVDVLTGGQGEETVAQAESAANALLAGAGSAFFASDEMPSLGDFYAETASSALYLPQSYAYSSSALWGDVPRFFSEPAESAGVNAAAEKAEKAAVKATARQSAAPAANPAPLAPIFLPEVRPGFFVSSRSAASEDFGSGAAPLFDFTTPAPADFATSEFADEIFFMPVPKPVAVAFAAAEFTVTADGEAAPKKSGTAPVAAQAADAAPAPITIFPVTVQAAETPASVVSEPAASVSESLVTGVSPRIPAGSRGAGAGDEIAVQVSFKGATRVRGIERDGAEVAFVEPAPAGAAPLAVAAEERADATVADRGADESRRTESPRTYQRPAKEIPGAVARGAAFAGSTEFTATASRRGVADPADASRFINAAALLMSGRSRETRGETVDVADQAECVAGLSRHHETVSQKGGDTDGNDSQREPDWGAALQPQDDIPNLRTLASDKRRARQAEGSGPVPLIVTDSVIV